MANTIRIKRRAAGGGAGAPTSLANAELAYNEYSDILYYGTGTGGVGGSATQVIAIAGKGAFVDTTTNQTIGGTKTFSNTISGSITGTAGKVANSLTIGAGLTNSGGSSFDGSAAITVALPTFNSSGSYGSSTSIPQITIDSYGRITAASTTSISTTINLAGNSGTGSVAGGGTLNINGGTGITTNASSSTITVSIDNTVVTLSGIQTLTNKTFNTADTGNVFKINGNQITSYTGSGQLVVLQDTPTLTNPAISTILNGSATLTLPTTTDTLIGRATTDTLTNKTFDTAGTGNVFKVNGNQISTYTGSGNSVVLSNSPSLTTPNIGAALATSITSSSGSIYVYAASGNNSVVLSPTGTGTIDASNKRITNVGTPVLASDAVNKAYADSIASSLNIHGSVAAATTSSVSYTYTSGGTSLSISSISSNIITFSSNHGLKLNSQIRTGGTAGNGLSTDTTYYVVEITDLNQVKISAVPGGSVLSLTDGSGLSISLTGDPGVGATLSGTPNTLDTNYSLNINDRVLVKDHSTSAYNGIYIVTTVGTGSNGVWTRSTDFDQSPTGEIATGDYVFVGSGTINEGNGWVQTASTPIRIGIDPITFTQFSGTGQITAGNGLTKSGNTLDVQVDGTTLDIVNDALQIKTSYVGQTSITTLGTISTGTWNATTISVDKGGTGLTSYTVGDLLYASTSNVLSKLAAVATGNVLISQGTGTAPTWGKVDLTSAISGILPVGNGGTGITTATTNGIIYGNGSSAFGVTSAGTWDSTNSVGQILSVNSSGVPTWTNTVDGGTF